MPDELELIAIQIPYGYTLIIEEGCIHGDTTLNGFFMMGMTSSHTTMGTADTVFLKFPETKKNVSMVLQGKENTNSYTEEFPILPAYVIYKGAEEAEKARFKELTKGENFIFNPFSKQWWKK